MLTVAFAKVSQSLKINGTAKVDSALWDIHFKSAEMIDKKGDAREVEKPLIDNGGIDLTLKVGLRKPKDEITYEAVIVNAGDMDAQIERIDYPELTEDQAKILEFIATYDTGMPLLENQSLKAKEEIKLEITVRFKDITDETLLKSEAYDIPLTFKINYIQSGFGAPAIDKEVKSILAQGANAGATSKFFNGPITEESVEKIKFMPKTKVSVDAIDSWDASLNKDGSVIAWYTDSNSNNLYELYIGGYGKVYAPENSGSLFQNFTKVVEIDFGDVFDTSNVTTMQSMFLGCSSLTSLDVSNFDTSSVTSMRWMFSSCTSLTSLDLSSFNVQNVTTMAAMFRYSSSLVTIKMNNLNAQNLLSVENMFYLCGSLKEIDMSNFEASNLTSMASMFKELSKLEKLNLSNSGTVNVTDMSNLFGGCSSLKELDLTNFKTNATTLMNGMFASCSSLVTLDLSSFDTSNVTDMTTMFEWCSSLTSLNLSSFNTSKVTNMKGMFRSCSSLTSLDLSSFNTINVTNMYQMFSNNHNLTILNLKKFDFSNVTNTTNMLYGVAINANITVGTQEAKDFLLGVRSDLTNITVET